MQVPAESSASTQGPRLRCILLATELRKAGRGERERERESAKKERASEREERLTEEWEGLMLLMSYLSGLFPSNLPPFTSFHTLNSVEPLGAVPSGAMCSGRKEGERERERDRQDLRPAHPSGRLHLGGREKCQPFRLSWLVD